VPLKLTLCGLPGALSVTVSLALSAAAQVGAKVAEIVHLAPAFSVLPQFVVSANWRGLVPVSAMLLMAMAAVPVFVRVTVLTELMELTA